MSFIRVLLDEFYYQSVRLYDGGIFTVLCNEIGDVAVLIVIAGIINFCSTNIIYYL